MSPSPESEEPVRDPRTGLYHAPKSYGNVGDDHWTKSRGERNQEAIEYYRSRSQAPGVAEGGAPRNFYCMRCDGVVPFDRAEPDCPHCGAPLDEKARRYFNWVEIDKPVESDLRALALPLVLGALVALALGFVLWRILR